MSQASYPHLPRLAVGGVIIQHDKALLVQRGRPPGQGLWAIPGGKVHLGETLTAAVERELHEETGLTVEVGEVVYVFDKIETDNIGQIQFHYVIIDFMATMVDSTQPLQPGDDALNAAWFTLVEITQPDFPISPTTLTLLQNLLRAT